MLKTIKNSLLSRLNRRAYVDPCFLIIGCQKCGTTSLYNYLIQHPQVITATRKEVHYFDIHFDNGYNWYLKHFPASDKDHDRSPVVAGEATPYYVFHPHAPFRVKETLPNARIILLMRDPVERAFSHYKHHVKFNIEPLGFEAAIEAEPERTDGEWEKMLADETYNSYELQMFSYLARGVYATQLERWLVHFPLNQMLLIQSEDFFSQPEITFSQTLQFLGLPDHQLTRYKKFNPGKDESMPEKIRRDLIDYFKPHNERLYRLIGRQFSWQG